MCTLVRSFFRSCVPVASETSETSKYPNPDIRLPSAYIWSRSRICLPIFGVGVGLVLHIRQLESLGLFGFGRSYSLFVFVYLVLARIR